MTRGTGIAVLLIALGTGGCSAISDFDGYEFGDDEVDAGFDAGTVDAGTDAGGDTDAGEVDGGGSDGGGTDAGTPRRPTGMVQSSGGATIVTDDYQLTISVGAPQPMGRRAGASGELILGPGAL